MGAGAAGVFEGHGPLRRRNRPGADPAGQDCGLLRLAIRLLRHQVGHGGQVPQRLAQQGLRRRPPRVAPQLVVAGPRPGAGRPGAEPHVGDPPGQREGLLHGVVPTAELLVLEVALAQGQQHEHRRGGIFGVPAVDEGLAAGQQLGVGQRAPLGGRGLREQEAVKSLGGLRPLELEQGQVPLPRRRARLPEGHGDSRRQAPAPRPPRQPEAAGCGTTNLPRAVAEGVGPRAHRPVLQVAAQVVGQRLGGRVPLGGALLEGLGHDVVEVAPQRAPELPGRGGAAGRRREARPWPPEP